MKSLKESILGSNNASIFGLIKDLILNGKTEKDLTELQKLWDKAGFGVKGCHWEIGWKEEMIYVKNTTILIISSNKNDWDIEITRDTWSSENYERCIKELVKKLENSGHFIIDKHPTGSEHWLAKIK